MGDINYRAQQLRAIDELNEQVKILIDRVNILIGDDQGTGSPVKATEAESEQAQLREAAQKLPRKDADTKG